LEIVKRKTEIWGQADSNKLSPGPDQAACFHSCYSTVPKEIADNVYANLKGIFNRGNKVRRAEAHGALARVAQGMNASLLSHSCSR
jgi:hypothetical protein